MTRQRAAKGSAAKAPNDGFPAKVAFKDGDLIAYHDDWVLLASRRQRARSVLERGSKTAKKWEAHCNSGLAGLPGRRVAGSVTAMSTGGLGGVGVTDLGGRVLGRVEGPQYEHAGLVRATRDGSQIVVASTYQVEIDGRFTLALWCWTIDALIAGREPRCVTFEDSATSDFVLDDDGTIYRFAGGAIVAHRPDGMTQRTKVSGTDSAAWIVGLATDWFVLARENDFWIVDRKGKLARALPGWVPENVAVLDDGHVVAASGSWKRRLAGGDDKRKLGAARPPDAKMKDGFVAVFEAASGKLVHCELGPRTISRGLAVTGRDVIASWDNNVTTHRF